MSTRLAPSRRRSTRTRLGAAAAAVVLPLALAGCGGGGGDNDGDDNGPASGGSAPAGPIGEVRGALDKVLDAKVETFELSLEDEQGNLKTALTSSKNVGPLAGTIIGGTVRVTVDPAGDRTLHDLSALGSAPFSKQVKAADASLAITADGGELGQVRLVGGVLFAKLDLDKIDAVAAKAGKPAFTSGLTSKAGADVAPLLADVRAGRWVKLDLNQYAGLLDGFVGATPSPAAGSAALLDGLVDAVLPAASATRNGDTYDLELKGKQALTAAAAVLQTSGLPVLGDLDPADLAAVPADGVLKASVAVEDGRATAIRVDLASISTLLPVEDRPASLAGGFLTVTIDDDAGSVEVPDDVSGVDAAALAMQYLNRVLGSSGMSLPK